MTHFITMVPSLWCSGTEPAMSTSNACTCFLSRKQVIVCSERFKDIKTSPSAAKSNNAAEGGQPASGLGEWLGSDGR